MKLWVAGRPVVTGMLGTLGQGGEADVYALGADRALKVFKAPSHPDFAGVPALEQAAAARLAEIGDKLRAFPAGLPATVVRPLDLATRLRRGDDVRGYAMARVDGVPLLHLAEPHWRRAHPVALATVVAAFRHLHVTVDAIHRAGVVIGDFNDGNVLVALDAGGGAKCWMIDADSWQFGRWRATMFTERFVDPRLCTPASAGATAPALAHPHDVDGDWFAFAVMLFRSLLQVGPYGGVLAPADPARRVPQAARPLHGISVLDPEVTYPRAAVPPHVLPDELVAHFRAVFEDGARGRFPADLLDRLRFRRCACGVEHARATCPACRTAVAVPAAMVRGRVRAVPLDAAHLAPASWTVGRTPAPGAPPVWLDGASLWRRGALGHAEPIGQVLPALTRAWVGAALGVGVYRAGAYTVAFVFRPDRRGLRDGVAIPRIRGALLDLHGVVGADRAWLWWREQLGGVERVRCAAITAAGEVVATIDAAPTDADAAWLAGVPGACAVGPYLFVPTDAGIVRVEASGGAIAVTRTFPDTAELVGAGDALFAGPGGLDARTRDGAVRITLA